MHTVSDMNARFADTAIYRLRPNHGIAFLDIEIPVSDLARMKACFVEETFADGDGNERTVLLPVDDDHMFDDGSAWHPETFKPLGPNEAIWLSGYQGIRPFVGHWLPLPYLRVMSSKATSGLDMDRGPLNWVRLFISPPDGPLQDAATLSAVLAIDTQLDGGSRLDHQRYTAPSVDDVSLGSNFALSDAPDQIGSFLGEVWLGEWLDAMVDAAGDDGAAPPARFANEPIARYLFLLQVLSKVCRVPILRFAGPAPQRMGEEADSSELILDLSDDVGLAVIATRRADDLSSDVGRSRVLPLRDLGAPTKVHAGALPVRVEFDAGPFGDARISRRSGRSDAFQWSSLVRIGEEAARLALRANAASGTTGSAALARYAQDVQPIAGLWRNGSESRELGPKGAPSRGAIMQHLSESGEFIGARKNAQPALRPRFSRSSLLTLFIAELMLQAISHINTPRRADAGDGATAREASALRTLRLSLPLSGDAAERDMIVKRAREAIDLIWHAQGWDGDGSALAPPKPSVELGLGGDFGVQIVYLHNQLSDVYGGDIAAFIEDLDPLRQAEEGELRPLQFASIAIGHSATRAVAAEYRMVENGGIRPQLLATHSEPHGVDALLAAVIDEVLMPAVDTALQALDPDLPAGEAHRLLGRTPAGATPHPADAPYLSDDIARRLEDKVLRPAARAILDIYVATPTDSAAGIELSSLAGLVAHGGGRFEPLGALVNEEAAVIGVDGLRLGDVAVPLVRRRIREVILDRLHGMLGVTAGAIDVEQTDLLFITSTLAASDDLRDLFLSLLPISPHRLVILDERWNAQRSTFAASGGAIGVAIGAGVLGTVIGGRRLLEGEALAGIGQPLQLESEVA